jgi:hypothetical protein
MNKARFSIALSLAAVLLLSGQIFARYIFNSQPVQARQAESAKKHAGEKWEYAALFFDRVESIDGISIGSTRVRTYIFTFQTSGLYGNPVEGLAEGKNNFQGARDDAFAKAIAKLGEDGWEMTVQGPYQYGTENKSEAIYFKRLKQ